jgi:2-polyprenyl-6-methoxyphenol hydroxylase-like FAD-dependent oxidoreductase
VIYKVKCGDAGRWERRRLRQVKQIAVRPEETSMANRIGEQAVVIGAGIGGLAASAALADFFANVIVLERDELSSELAPRAGVPQGKHAHGLLVGGQRALEDLFPGFTADLLAAGAVQINAGLDSRIEQPGYDPFPNRDLGVITYAMSRPLLEHVVRQHATRPGNVSLRPKCSVREIIATADGSAVKAVRYENDDGSSATLAADLVVDASGRGAPTMAFLRAHGHSRRGRLPSRWISVTAQLYSRFRKMHPATGRLRWCFRIRG